MLSQKQTQILDLEKKMDDFEFDWMEKELQQFQKQKLSSHALKEIKAPGKPYTTEGTRFVNEVFRDIDNLVSKKRFNLAKD